MRILRIKSSIVRIEALFNTPSIPTRSRELNRQEPKDQSALLKNHRNGSMMRWVITRPVVSTETQKCIITTHQTTTEKTRQLSTRQDKHDTGKIPLKFISPLCFDYIKQFNPIGST